MQSGYGRVFEIQQFMLQDTPFSVSSTTPSQNPSATSPSPSVVGGVQQVHHFTGATPFHKSINPFQPHLHPHQHAHSPPSPPPPMQFPLFHSSPITQQLFTRLPHHQRHQHHLQLFQPTPPLLVEHEAEPENNSRSDIMPSFHAANMHFKLFVDESSGSGTGTGRKKDLDNDNDNDNDNNNITGGILQSNDASESRFRSWHRQEDCHIKEPFWRPLNLDCINQNNKRSYKDKEALQQSTAPSGSNYYSELEAIYRPGGSTYSTTTATATDGACTYKNNYIINTTNQTTASGSALTGDDRPIMPTTAAATALDDNNSTGAEPHPNFKKTRQQSRRCRGRLMRHVQMESSIAAFFSGLVKQLMDHQETLHQRFFDAMERRDCERVGREETWREQEAVRTRREAAARAQDRALTVARETAIISFLEKITGETLNLPANYPQPITIASSDANVDQKQDNACQGAYNIATSILMTKTSRWPKSEVQALIGVRSELEGRFQEPGLKGPLWEEVSASMAAIGYQRSAKRCKEKWENINKYFRKAKDNGRKRSHHTKTCPYFQQLDQLYSKSKSLHDDPPPGALQVLVDDEHA